MDEENSDKIVPVERERSADEIRSKAQKSIEEADRDHQNSRFNRRQQSGRASAECKEDPNNSPC
jgi:hypothetical protein